MNATIMSSFAEQAFTLVRPGLLMLIAIYHFIMTTLEIIFVDRQPMALFNLTKLRYRSFARLWSANGEAMSQEMPGPLFELVSQCKGVILDVGPGSGEMIPMFNPDQITAIYGAEPAADLHAGLRRRAQETGFGTKFYPLLCGAEPESLIPALHKSGIVSFSGKGGLGEDGIFDEICCIRVLCGVPHPQQTIRSLYNLLKPGGRMVICEHVANPWRTKVGSVLGRSMQVVYTILGWRFFMGGCELQRHTYEYLKDAGEWDKFDLHYCEPAAVIPFIVGELRKKGDVSGTTCADIVKD